MKNNNDIDKLFESKLSNQEFAFSETAWNSMEAMLDKKKKRKAILWWWISGVSVLGVVFIFWMFYGNPNLPKEQTSINEHQQVNTTNNLPQNSAKEQKQSEAKIVDTQTQKQRNTQKKTDNQQQFTVNNPKPVSNKESIQKATVKTHKKQRVLASNSLLNSKTKENEEKLLVSQSEKENKEKPETNLKTTTAPSTTKEKEVEKAKTEKIKLRKNNKIPHEEYEELGLAENQKLPLIDRMNWIRKTSIGVVGGANISRGLHNTSSLRPIPSLRPIGGIRASYLIDELITLNTNVLYRVRSALGSETVEVSDKGLTQSTQSIALSYIDIPIYIKYEMNRNFLIFGIQYSQFVRAKELIVSDVSNNGVITHQSNVVNSKTQKFSNSDIGPMIGYEYLLREKLNIGVRAQYGLFDLTDNTSFRNNQIDNNLEIRIVIDYSIFEY